MSTDQTELTTVAIRALTENPTNPRQHYDDGQLAELAESIRSVGLLQPIVVRRLPGRKKFEIVCGHRRARAAKLAGLEELLAIVKTLSDREAALCALVENSQRSDVSPLEESVAFARLVGAGVEVEEIAARLGRPKRFVSERLSLQRLVPAFNAALAQGQLPLGGALVLATLPEDRQELLAGKTLKPAEGGKAWTIEAVRNAVIDSSQALSCAPFALDDATYTPMPCTRCTMRSDAQAELFGTSDAAAANNARCLMTSCFDAKREQLYERKRAAGFVILSTTEVGHGTAWAGVSWVHRESNETWDVLASRCSPSPRYALVYGRWSSQPQTYVNREEVLARLTDAGDPAAAAAIATTSPEAEARRKEAAAQEAAEHNAYRTRLAQALMPAIAVAEFVELQTLAHILVSALAGCYPGALPVEQRWRAEPDGLAAIIDAEFVTTDALRRICADLIVQIVMQNRYRANSALSKLHALAGFVGATEAPNVAEDVLDGDTSAEDDLDEEVLDDDDDSDGCLGPAEGDR